MPSTRLASRLWRGARARGYRRVAAAIVVIASLEAAFAQFEYHEWISVGEDIQQVKLKTLRDAVEKYPCIVLLGDPGCGKSTTIEALAYDTAREPDRLPVRSVWPSRALPSARNHSSSPET